MGSGSGNLALVARSELGQIAVVVTLPVREVSLTASRHKLGGCLNNAHLVVEHLGLASLGLGDQRLVQDIQDILANLLQLSLDLLAVFANDGNVLLRALGLLLLLDGGDDAPGGTAGTNNVLVSNGQEVALIDGKLAANLHQKIVSITGPVSTCQTRGEDECIIRWRLPVQLISAGVEPDKAKQHGFDSPSCS